MTGMTESRWRTGRKVGRTIYAMVGDEASDDDLLIGVMDSAELAAEAVDAHNGMGGFDDEGSSSFSLQLGEPETGLWCETCGLPSVIRASLHCITKAGVGELPALEWCVEHEPMLVGDGGDDQ